MISVPFLRRPGRVLCSVIVAAAAFAAGCSSSPDTVQQKQIPRYQQPLIDLTEDARAICSYAGGTPSLIREFERRTDTRVSVCQRQTLQSAVAAFRKLRIGIVRDALNSRVMITRLLLIG